MSVISASMVKELRGRTGSGMMECKKALLQTDGDLEKAIDIMRASGAAKAAKAAGRIAAEGLIDIKFSDDNKTAIILEINSETDFVAKSPDFINFVNQLSDLAIKTLPKNIKEFTQNNLTNGGSVNKAREDIIAKIGENINIRRTDAVCSTGIVVGYKHGGGRIAVLVAIDTNNKELAKNIAMHIAASKPKAIDENDLSNDIIDREKAIFIEQAKKSGKSDDIIEKMIIGKMRKFIAESTLLGQNFIKDSEITIKKLLSNNNAKVLKFIRYEVGEGIEKAKDDFVAEVMAQVKS